MATTTQLSLTIVVNQKTYVLVNVYVVIWNPRAVVLVIKLQFDMIWYMFTIVYDILEMRFWRVQNGTGSIKMHVISYMLNSAFTTVTALIQVSIWKLFDITIFAILLSAIYIFEETIDNQLIVNHFFAFALKKNNCLQIDLNTDTISLHELTSIFNWDIW